MEKKYVVEISCGGTYCGNGFFNTIEECKKFLEDDGFCDKAVIYDLETQEKTVVKLTNQK